MMERVGDLGNEDGDGLGKLLNHQLTQKLKVVGVEKFNRISNTFSHL